MTPYILRRRALIAMLRVFRSHRLASAPWEPMDSWSVQVQALLERFPQWTVVGSPLRGLWAMCNEVDVPIGCPETLAADNVEAMEQQLAEATKRLRCH